MESEEFRLKLSNAMEAAEKYAWIYYLIVLVFLGGLKIGIVTSQDIIIDAILTITAIALGAQAINKIKNRNNPNPPQLQCLNCKNPIPPVGEWTCKKCGWKSTFPDDDKTLT